MESISFVEKLAIVALSLVFAVTLHEIAHGYTVNFFGDSTAKNLGRLTLNSTSHIDLIGSIIIPTLLFMFSKGTFCFGYAKPVPVIFSKLKRPRLHMICVALGGPGANLIQAIFWSLAFIFAELLYPSTYLLLKAICSYGILINVILLALNLFPLPPLDGARVLSAQLPEKFSKLFSKIELFGLLVVIFLLLEGIFSDFWIKPLMGLIFIFFDLFVFPIKMLLNVGENLFFEYSKYA